MVNSMLDFNIVLIGFMGTGKTTVSELLSQNEKMEMIEMDQYIAKQEQMSIPQIFEQKGEEYFRNLETKLLIDLQETKNLIISCGGGVPLRECNVVEMKKNGKVVLLTATPETIYERVKNDENRPVLKGRKNAEGIKQLLEERREKYEKAADITVSTDHKTVQEICEEIMNKVNDKK